MIKKLLKFFFRETSYNNKIVKIEKYLSKSSDLYDLEYKIRELDKENKNNQFLV